MQAEADVGFALKNKIVPNAVHWFTGEVRRTAALQPGLCSRAAQGRTAPPLPLCAAQAKDDDDDEDYDGEGEGGRRGLGGAAELREDPRACPPLQMTTKRMTASTRTRRRRRKTRSPRRARGRGRRRQRRVRTYCSLTRPRSTEEAVESGAPARGGCLTPPVASLFDACCRAPASLPAQEEEEEDEEEDPERANALKAAFEKKPDGGADGGADKPPECKQQ